MVNTINEVEESYWYVFSTPVSREKSAKERIESVILEMQASNIFGPVVLPTREEVSKKNGQIVTVTKTMGGFLFLRVKGKLVEAEGKQVFVPHSLLDTFVAKVKPLRLFSRKALSQKEMDKMKNENIDEKTDDERRHTNITSGIITKNTLVRVVRGPFRGFEAIVMNDSDNDSDFGVAGSIRFFDREIVIPLAKDEIAVISDREKERF